MTPSEPVRAQLRTRQFLPAFGNDLGVGLLVALSPSLKQYIDVIHDIDVPVYVHTCRRVILEADVAELARTIGVSGARFSVLVITDTEVEYFHASELRNAKVAAISFFSRPFSASDLDAIANLVQAQDYDRELEDERKFLAAFDRSEFLTLGTDRSTATFRHRTAPHWFSLAGALDFGHQTVLPTGELSALRLPSGEFDLTSRLELDGTVLLSGVAIVHRGSATTPLDSTLALQRSLTPELATGVLACIERGLIVDLLGPTSESKSILRCLMYEDFRYRLIHEIGFGLNPCCARLREDNWFPNERCPGVHFGLGLGGHTRFHVDIVCPCLTILAVDQDGVSFRLNQVAPTT